MVNWYAIGLAVAVIYIIPKRHILTKLRNFQKYKALNVPLKTVVVIMNDIGLNYEKARSYAKTGARLIIGGCSQSKIETAKKELVRSCQNQDILTIPIRTHDKKALRTFAESIITSQVAVDVIINNRGAELSELDIIFSTQELAKERFTNHCLNFLYTPESTEDL